MPETARQRPWIGVLFECCSVYARLWRTGTQTEYRGACPRCGRTVRLQVGTGGTEARIFRAR